MKCQTCGIETLKIYEDGESLNCSSCHRKAYQRAYQKAYGKTDKRKAYKKAYQKGD